MAWKHLLKLTIPAIGVQDCVVSWSPLDEMLRIWFIRHVVLKNNGTLPDFIASFAGEVADWTQYLPGKTGAPLTYRQIVLEVLGYGATAVLAPKVLAGINALKFKYAVPYPGGLETAGVNPVYEKGNPKGSNVFINFRFDNDLGLGKPTLPVSYLWGASFALDPILVPLRIGVGMLAPFTKLQLRTNIKGPKGDLLFVGEDAFGVSYLAKDVTANYAQVAKGVGIGKWSIPNRVVLIQPNIALINPWKYSLMKPNFFNVMPKSVWLAFRFGHELQYAVAPNGDLLGPKGKGQNSISSCKYEEAYSEIWLNGWFD